MTTTDELTANDAEILRRAATACRNVAPDAKWFGWVPNHLDRLADRIDPPTLDTADPTVAAPDTEGRGQA